MNQFTSIKTFLVLLIPILISQCEEAVSVKKSFVIDSKILSEKISITTYGIFPDDENIPIVYITDGQKMIENGALDRIKELTDQRKIPEAYYVFVSTIHPETNQDQRNTYFFCNDKYIRFFEEELIPLEGSLSLKVKQRSLIGISFGGLSAAYFSGKTTLFQNYALLSPITYPCKEALSAIAFSENKNLNIFISTGTHDAENYVGPLYQLYTSKGFHVKQIKTEGAHDFDNWNGQWEEVLNFLNTKK
ncbi:alpha/beta hydrolase-fold protein [uncultured Dokdonia sp.]|uniref:alpha/beta hydrolase n=1 Tax=uncultured Dokdonia sp. TaxID=575653 RepID=UPI002625442C|nr:alpha/beta hydrolase-fold protein [uncultured Dokdonia sp.]